MGKNKGKGRARKGDDVTVTHPESEEELSERKVVDEMNMPDSDDDMNDEEMGDFVVPEHMSDLSAGSSSEESESEGEEEEEEEESDSEKETEESSETQTVLTEELVQKWVNGANGNSIRAIRKLVKAFFAGANLGETIDPPAKSQLTDRAKRAEYKKKRRESLVQSRFPYAIVHSEVFDFLMKAMANGAPAWFNGFLGRERDSKKTPPSFSGWKKIQRSVRLFLESLLHVIDRNADDSLSAYILSVVSKELIVWYACFPKLAKDLVRRALSVWESAEATTRSIAFDVIRSVATALPSFLESILKTTYKRYVRNAKFFGVSQRKNVQLMAGHVVDLFSMNAVASYQCAFLSIRHLASLLRDATSHAPSSRKALAYVHSWQFVNALRLWTSLLCSFHKAGRTGLEDLVYPLSQVIFRLLAEAKTMRLIPLRFLCAEMLCSLVEEIGMYVPLVPALLEVFEWKNMKTKPSSGSKQIDFDGAIRLSKKDLSSRVVQDHVAETSLRLVRRFLVANSYSISYPEMSFPIETSLRTMRKKNAGFRWNRLADTVIRQSEQNAEWVRKQRQEADIAPKDVSSLFFLRDRSKERSVLSLSSVEENVRSLRSVKSGDAIRESGKQSNSADRKAGVIEAKLEKSVGKKRKAEKAIVEVKRIAQSRDEDVVEEFHLSSSESEDDE